MKKNKKSFICMFLAILMTGCSINIAVVDLNSSKDNNSLNIKESSSSLSSKVETATNSIIYTSDEMEIINAVSKLELNDRTVVYDGKPHSIFVEGDIPHLVEIVYVENEKVNVGEYKITAILVDKSEYHLDLPILEATLTIEKSDINVTFDSQTFSYDGKEHSIYINEQLPEGVNVTYTNNNKVKAGSYTVTAKFEDTTGNYTVPSDISSTLTIVKDGKYHDLTIIYEDGTIEEKVVENGYVIESLPLGDEDNNYINQDTNEEIIFPYTVTDDAYIVYGNISIDFEFSLSSGNATITGYNGNNPNLVIPKYVSDGTNKYPVVAIGSNAFESYGLKSVTILEGVTSIGDYAFYGCSSLTSITLPSTLASIGDYTFSECSSLTSITLPSTLPSIGDYAFSGCSSLTSITLPSIGDYTFSGCSSLISITLPSILTSIGYDAFRGCSSLTSIVIPESVTSIGAYAFSWCSSLTSIVIPESVTSIGDCAFSWCSSLTSIVISEGVTSIGDSAFEYCSSLTIYCEASSKPSGWNLDWNYSNRPVYWGINENNYIEIEGIEYVIIDGEAVVSRYVGNNTEVIIPSTIEIKGTTYNITSIRSYAFYNCSSLTSIIFEEGSQLTSIGEYAFSWCSSLTSITLPNSLTSIENYAFEDCRSLTSIVIPESVTSIGEYAFFWCSSLTSITLPNTLTSIGEMAFSGCISLTSILIPEGVTSIGSSAFLYCSKLTIYCEHTSQPLKWNASWNPSNRPVYWSGQWEYVNGVPTPIN